MLQLFLCQLKLEWLLKSFLRGPRRRVIEDVMKKLKGTPAEGKVSYADLIALGGAYAVSVTGGPTIAVPIGELARICFSHVLYEQPCAGVMCRAGQPALHALAIFVL
jgi:hypothetical protein